jgi:hypothetical protein
MHRNLRNMFIKEKEARVMSMRKIGELKRSNANIPLAILLGVVITAIFSFLSMQLFQFFHIFKYLKNEHIVEMFITLPVILFAFFIHECIHIVFFLVFGKGMAKIKVYRDRSVGAVIMHQVNPAVVYTRTQMIVILLSPLIVLTISFWLLSIFISTPYLFWVNTVLNALGSTIDIYVSILLLIKPYKNVHVNFEPDQMVMNVFAVK